jgi:hypothetical protein
VDSFTTVLEKLSMIWKKMRKISAEALGSPAKAGYRRRWAV